jgi:hypothetical protein
MAPGTVAMETVLPVAPVTVVVIEPSGFVIVEVVLVAAAGLDPPLQAGFAPCTNLLPACTDVPGDRNELDPTLPMLLTAISLCPSLHGDDHESCCKNYAGEIRRRMRRAASNRPANYAWRHKGSGKMCRMDAGGGNFKVDVGTFAAFRMGTFVFKTSVPLRPR